MSLLYILLISMMHLYGPKIVTYMNILAEWTIMLCLKLYSSEQVLLVRVSLPNIFASILFSAS